MWKQKKQCNKIQISNTNMIFSLTEKLKGGGMVVKKIP